MKTFTKKITLGLLLLAGILTYSPTQADPPGMPGDHGSSGDQPPGGGAPIGGGLLILSGLALAYGITRKKVEYTIVEDDN